MTGAGIALLAPGGEADRAEMRLLQSILTRNAAFLVRDAIVPTPR